MNYCKLVFYGLVLICLSSAVIGIDPNCPLSSSMTACSPKCKDDSQCHGKKCCPNICNERSCVPDHLAKGSQNNGYKSQNSKSATGTYCGNVKCNSYEKCELDKSSKRQKCVRS